MRVKEFIVEGRATPILVVDIQPAYHTHCSRIVKQVMQLINKQKGDVIVLYNDQEMSNDTVEDVFGYFEDNGLDNNSTIERISWHEKQYAFLRNWMDTNVPDEAIIKVIRMMAQNKIHDSRDLHIDDILEKYGIDKENNIYMPDYVPIALLKRISPFYMVGGGRTECLREIELICNAFNIRYKRIDSLIY